MKDLIIYGAGGFGREIASLIKAINQNLPTWNLMGFVDDGVKTGISNHYGKVLGSGELLNEYDKPLDVIIAIAMPLHRIAIVKRITNPLISWPNLIAPDVKFLDSETFKIGRGNILFYSCRISCDVTIGDFNLLNSLVSLGHDTKIGSYNVLMPNVRISGESVLGDQNFFGVNSLMLQGLKVGCNTRIGAASVLLRNTKDNFLYFGNPAKIVKDH